MHVKCGVYFAALLGVDRILMLHILDDGHVTAQHEFPPILRINFPRNVADSCPVRWGSLAQ